MSRAIRTLSLALALGLAVPGAFVTAPRSYAAACNPDNHVAGDLNSDGLADVVVGIPSFDDDRGAVDILYSDGLRRLVRSTDLGRPTSPGDRFGESVALGDVNNDGCDDLAVGAPGTANSQGTVFLAAGAPDDSLSVMATFDGQAPHGSFGAEVVLLTPQQLTNSGWVRTNQQLVVSSPTADDGSAWEAGLVTVLPLTSTGTLTGSRVELTQNSPGVPGTSENGDRFGTALAGQDRTIIVGTPDEAVGTRASAGSATILSATNAARTTFAGVGVTQNTAGFPGTAETGDRFGAAVAIRDNYGLIGVPGEDIGADSDTGSVQIVNYNPATRKVKSLRAVDQDSAGIPGANEDHDAFGAAVALGINTLDQLTAIVGAPGEAIGSVSGAGAVTLFRANRSGGQAAALRQGAGGIPGAVEAGDHFGASVAALGGNLDDGEAMLDGLVIGAPNEDIGSIGDAGSVSYTRNTNTWYALVFEDAPGGDIPADARYGESLASAAA